MQPQSPHHPPRRHSVGDITLTVVLAMLACLGALAAVFFSSLFVMATDSCGPHQCDYHSLDAAYVVTWGGAGAAILIGAVGITLAAVRDRLMWIWPAVSLLLIAVTTSIGASLANSVMHQN